MTKTTDILKTRLPYMLAIIMTINLMTFEYTGILSVLTVPAQIMGVICVYQIANFSKKNFVMGIISSIIFALNAYVHGLNADVLLQIGYIVFDVLGIINWRGDKKPISISSKELILSGLSAVLLMLIFKVTISNLWIDAIVTSAGMLAMYFTSRAYKNSFYIWLPMNALQAIMWFITFYVTNGQAPITMGILYLVYLYNSIVGFKKWNERKTELA